MLRNGVQKRKVNLVKSRGYALKASPKLPKATHGYRTLRGRLALRRRAEAAAARLGGGDRVRELGADLPQVHPRTPRRHLPHPGDLQSRAHGGRRARRLRPPARRGDPAPHREGAARVKSRAFWLMQVGGWLAFVVALVVPWLGAFPLPRMLWNKLPLIATGFAVTLALRFAYRRFLQRGAPIWLLAAAGVAGSWLGSLLWSAATSLVVRQTGVGAIERGTLIRAAIDRTDDTLYFTLVLLTWSLLYFGIALYRSSVRAQALAHEARLEALRYQIQPHLLFNALNALSTLIVERRNDEASRMVAQLAGFFQVTLEGTGTEIPLREEIEFARRYLELEAVRFAT